MNIRFFLIAVVSTIAFIILAFVLPRQYRKVWITLVVAACLIIGGTLCLYALNPTFRREVNITVNRTETHTYILSNQQYDIPLPPKTTINYRTSDTQAVYVSKTEKQDIVQFYSDIAENGFLEKDTGDSVAILFGYEGDRVSITIEPMGNFREIMIDVMDELHRRRRGNEDAIHEDIL